MKGVLDIARTVIIIKKEIEDTINEPDAETKKLMITRFRQMNTETANKLADKLEAELQSKISG